MNPIYRISIFCVSQLILYNEPDISVVWQQCHDVTVRAISGVGDISSENTYKYIYQRAEENIWK
jgi:hypothetical protein